MTRVKQGRDNILVLNVYAYIFIESYIIPDNDSFDTFFPRRNLDLD